MKPKTLADEPIYTRLSPEDMAEFEAIRKERGISRSELARDLISWALATNKAEEAR